jgi:DNA-binding CsgD family transcriptional regulator
MLERNSRAPNTGKAETRRKRQLLVLIGFQLALSLLYVVEYITYWWIGFDDIPWEMVELYEISEGLFAFAGIGISISLIFMLLRRNREVETQLKAASGAFHQLMRERFDAWRLSPSEAEVALFTIKGMSNAEIARLRGTSEGTIKAQSNAIFRKAGVNNRSQLLGVFVEDLVGGAIVEEAPATRAMRDETTVSHPSPVALDAGHGLKEQ